MHEALLLRSVEALAAIGKHASFSAALRSTITTRVANDESSTCGGCASWQALLDGSTDATNWRVIDHCAVVSRSYALFETFVLAILTEYIVFLSASYSIADLGRDFVDRYTRGIGKILYDQGKSRYRNINVVSLIVSASDALSGKPGYHIQAESLLRPEQNLRMPELARIFSECGLYNLEAWVTSHSAMISFFSEASRLSDTASNQLRQIVDYRNEASHGEVDEVLGADVLAELTQFVSVLCGCIKDFIQYDILRRSKSLGKAVVIGQVSERFSNNVVVAKLKNCAIAVGDALYSLGKGVSYETRVLTLQIDGVDAAALTLTEETEVGITLAHRVKVGAELIRVQ